jgi:2-isopropylmalate synthase
MALRTRETFFNACTHINSQRLYPVSRLVSSITGMPIPRNKAVVGENAFAHESGIHQHGMLKHASTYKIMRPVDVGLTRSSLVLWQKHSGRHALRERVRQLGFTLEDAEFERALRPEIKALADKKKELFDGDIEALVLRAEEGNAGPWSLGSAAADHSVRPSTAAVARRSRCRTRMVRGWSAAPAATAPSTPRSRPSRKRPACIRCCRSSNCAASPKARNAQGEAEVV